MDHSIVEWLRSEDDNEPSNCGYCKNETCYTNDGLWAHCMTPDDYQEWVIYLWYIFSVTGYIKKLLIVHMKLTILRVIVKNRFSTNLPTTDFKTGFFILFLYKFEELRAPSSPFHCVTMCRVFWSDYFDFLNKSRSRLKTR